MVSIARSAACVPWSGTSSSPQTDSGNVTPVDCSDKFQVLPSSDAKMSVVSCGMLLHAECLMIHAA